MNCTYNQCEYDNASLYNLDLCNDYKFQSPIKFLVDSAETHYVVNNKNVLLNYSEHDILVAVTTAYKGIVSYSIGEGRLPLYL